MNDPKPDRTPRCTCQNNGVNPPLSAVAVYAIIPGPNERIATVTRCEYCGSISRLEASARAQTRYKFTPAGLERLLSQTRVPSFTPEELAAGTLPGAVVRERSERPERSEPTDVLRPAPDYNPDQFTEPAEPAGAPL